MVIVAPDIGETAIGKRLDALRKSIADAGGEVIFEDLWGLRSLSYNIRKHDQGYYAVLDINIDPIKLKEFDRMLRLEPEVLRHLMMKLPSVYQPKTLVEMEAEAAKEAEAEALKEGEKKDKKPRMGGAYTRPGARVETPKVEVKQVEAKEEPAAPKASRKVEAEEAAPEETLKEAPKKAPKKKDADADKKALEDIDAKLDSILSNPDLNF